MGKNRTHYSLRNVRADIRMELKMMLAEVLPMCSAGSREFNSHAIAWIERNGERFRKKWERYQNGKKKCMQAN